MLKVMSILLMAIMMMTMFLSVAMIMMCTTGNTDYYCNLIFSDLRRLVTGTVLTEKSSQMMLRMMMNANQLIMWLLQQLSCTSRLNSSSHFLISLLLQVYYYCILRLENIILLQFLNYVR